MFTTQPDGTLIQESTCEAVRIERVYGLYTTKYKYHLSGRGAIDFHEEVNQTHLRSKEWLTYQQLPDQLKEVLLTELAEYDKDKYLRDAFWI